MRLSFLATIRAVFGAAAALIAAAAAEAQTALPNAQVGQAYSYQVTTSPAAPSGTIYAATNLPTGLSINASSGAISGTPTAAGTSAGLISLTSGGLTNNFTYQLTVNAATGTPAITSPVTATGTVGSAFTYNTVASNGPITGYNVGALPGGLSASSSTGVISGAPTAAGTYTVSIGANNASGSGASVTLTITVNPAASTPVISSAAATSGPVGNAFSYTITASNGPTSFSAVGLPLGLSLNATTGVISGTPTIAGISTITLSASNGNGTGPTASLTLTIGSFSTITSPASLAATTGSASSFTLTANNSPTSFNVAGLPSGLSLAAATGVISGTVSTAGTYTLTVSANNNLGQGPSTTVTLTVSTPSSSSPPPQATAPSITTQPESQSVTVGGSATFSVAASGTDISVYEWYFNGEPFTGGTSPVLTIADVTAANAGTYTVLVEGEGGSVLSAGATLTVTSLFVPAITITTQPVSQTVGLGGSVTFSVAASGTGTLAYQWQFNGNPIGGATGASLVLTNVLASQGGSYTVTVSGTGQTSATSNVATLTVGTSISIATQPASQSAAVGASVSFSVGATGSGTLSYQWQFNGAPIAGATGPTLALTNVQAGAAGAYSVTITNGVSTVTSNFVTLTVTIPPSRLVNMSVRGFTGSGSQALIVGFTVGGAGSKSALVRAIGPTLGTAFGVTGTLNDPTLTLYNSVSVPIASNTGWGGGSLLATLFNQVGAFSLPASSKDSALSESLPSGGYTALASGVSGDSGVVLLELYDADTSANPSAAFVNMSGRGVAGSGSNVLTLGFVVEGTTPITLLVRGVGPTLANFGITGALANPTLTLFNSNSVAIASNTVWGGSTTLSSTFAAAGAFSLPANSADSALVLTLNPGVYTAEVSGPAGASGTALIELYYVP